MFELVKYMLKNKNGQLVALEIKLFLIGLLIGLVGGIAAIVILGKMGRIDFLMNMICPSPQ